MSFMWGMFGVDRMYLGKWGTGVLKLVTLGGGGVWIVVDMWRIMRGAMRDVYGRELLQYHEYKPLAQKAVLIYAVVIGLITLIGGLLLILGAFQVIDWIETGQTPEFLNGITQGLDGLDGLTPEQRVEFGL